MPTAYVHLPPHVHYRREAFINGFARLGYIVEQRQPSVPLIDGNIAVIWNKSARSEQTLEMARKGDGALIVAENGYIGVDQNGHQPYALALDGHCGSGRWYAPDDSRLKQLDIDFQPFRVEEGDRVVIAEQRGIGSRLMRSPQEWGQKMIPLLKEAGWRPYLRPHPGVDKNSGRPLMDDLKNARCLVVWSSNCATTALIAGVPVYYCAPTIITAPGARMFDPHLDLGTYDNLRYEAFSRLAWAQWTLAEISSGLALETLRHVHAGRLPSCKPGYDL